jgi:hypothetical protein
MKRAITIFVLSLLLLVSIIKITEARVGVRGYYRGNGTYVQPHYRSDPDSSRWNNWSTKGNYNPYTGKKGYQNPYKSYRFR